MELEQARKRAEELRVIIAKNMPLYTSAPETCPPAAARPLNTGTKVVK